MTTITIKIKNPCKRSEGEYFSNNNLGSFTVEINGKLVPQVKRFAIDLDQEKMKYDYSNLSCVLEKYLDVVEQFYPDSNKSRDGQELIDYWED